MPLTYNSLGIAITGASGVIYGLRLIEKTLELGIVKKRLIIAYSGSSEEVAKYEEGISLKDELQSLAEKHLSDSNQAPQVIINKENDFSSPLASSSAAPDALVIIPCSVKTMGEIAHGIANNIITRGALAMLRLRRPLILVPRETPLGIIEIELMLKLAQNGALIVPAMPGFYHRPRSVQDMIDFVVGKVLDVLQIDHDLYKRWGT